MPSSITCLLNFLCPAFFLFPIPSARYELSGRMIFFRSLWRISKSYSHCCCSSSSSSSSGEDKTLRTWLLDTFVLVFTCQTSKKPGQGRLASYALSRIEVFGGNYGQGSCSLNTQPSRTLSRERSSSLPVRVEPSVQETDKNICCLYMGLYLSG